MNLNVRYEYQSCQVTLDPFKLCEYLIGLGRCPETGDKNCWATRLKILSPIQAFVCHTNARLSTSCSRVFKRLVRKAGKPAPLCEHGGVPAAANHKVSHSIIRRWLSRQETAFGNRGELTTLESWWQIIPLLSLKVRSRLVLSLLTLVIKAT